jgi:beta-glucuronidase
LKKRQWLLLFLLTLIMSAKSPESDKWSIFELKEVDGVPLFYEYGMPYFTRFTATDHQALDLSGTWKFQPDPSDQGREQEWFKPDLDDSSWFNHPIPGTWTMQKPEWLGYRGVGWYRYKFTVPAGFQGRFNRLVLDGVVYYGEVYLNGKYLGCHQGGFSRFSLDVSDRLNYSVENLLVIRVDNRLGYDAIPGQNSSDPNHTGWWSYGGINRRPILESGPQFTAAKLAVDTDHLGSLKGVAVFYNHSADPVSADLNISLYDLAGKKLAGLKSQRIEAPAKGTALVRFEAMLKDIKPWSPEQPQNRYSLSLEMAVRDSSEKQSVEIGFRRFEFKDGKAWLNGKPVFLRGINRHEDFPDTGAVQTDYWIAKDMGLIKELHVNFMRMAHYPHNPAWLDAADKNGVMITHEIPNYWSGKIPRSVITVAGTRYNKSCEQQLMETIERDRNHPAVVMWSIGNENATYLEPVRQNHIRLFKLAKKFDPARPVTYATDVPADLERTLSIVDVIFVNEYFGWYVGDASQVGAYLDQYHKRFPDKPIVVSEFGAGAVPGIKGDEVFMPGSRPQRFTEDYQVEFYREQIKQILSRPYVVGMMPWSFADFRDASRPKHHPVANYNLKGVVTQKRDKKKVFSVLADTYARLEKDGKQ